MKLFEMLSDYMNEEFTTRKPNDTMWCTWTRKQAWLDKAFVGFFILVGVVCIGIFSLAITAGRL